MSPPSAEQIAARALAANGTRASLPSFPEMGTNVPGVIIISCADPRVIPEQIFALQPGEAIVFRNIAGHPHTAINGILALDVALKIESIIVVHHTDCGSTYWTDEVIRDGLKARTDHHEIIQDMQFGATTTSIEENLANDVNWLERHPLMRKGLAAKVHGYLYDIKTGDLTRIRSESCDNLK